MSRITFITISLVCLIISHANEASAWYDETHLAVAQAAGYDKWYNAAGADMTKIKAGSIERLNHYVNNAADNNITPEIVFQQIKHYNSPNHPGGHLYGAIMASIREYAKALKAGKYVAYHLAFCVHYIADLSQPLHNVPYDSFNRAHHTTNDGIVNKDALSHITKITRQMYPVTLRPDHFEEDLAGEIARIAGLSKALGLRMKQENRDMTTEEAYIQLGHSASLLKAVLKQLGVS